MSRLGVSQIKDYVQSLPKNTVITRKLIQDFIDEFASVKKELKDVSDIVASQDKRIEQLEMLVHNG